MDEGALALGINENDGMRCLRTNNAPHIANVHAHFRKPGEGAHPHRVVADPAVKDRLSPQTSNGGRSICRETASTFDKGARIHFPMGRRKTLNPVNKIENSDANARDLNLHFTAPATRPFTKSRKADPADDHKQRHGESGGGRRY